MPVKCIFYGYALFLFLGAYFGWKAGSMVSLIMALGSAALVLLGTVLLGTNVKLGMTILTSVGLVLTVVFLLRLLKTQSFMPSGMLLLVTVLYLLFCFTQFSKVN